MKHPDTGYGISISEELHTSRSCTLTPSPAKSSSDLIARQVLAQSAKTAWPAMSSVW